MYIFGKWVFQAHIFAKVEISPGYFRQIFCCRKAHFRYIFVKCLHFNQGITGIYFGTLFW